MIPCLRRRKMCLCPCWLLPPSGVSRETRFHILNSQASSAEASTDSSSLEACAPKRSETGLLQMRTPSICCASRVAGSALSVEMAAPGRGGAGGPAAGRSHCRSANQLLSRTWPPMKARAIAGPINGTRFARIPWNPSDAALGQCCTRSDCSQSVDYAPSRSFSLDGTALNRRHVEQKIRKLRREAGGRYPLPAEDLVRTDEQTQLSSRNRVLPS